MHCNCMIELGFDKNDQKHIPLDSVWYELKITEVNFLWLIPFIGIGILQQLVNMFIWADGISSWGAMNQFDLLCRTLVCRFAPHSDWSPDHCCFQQISTHGALQLISWGHFLSSAKFKFVVYCETQHLDLRQGVERRTIPKKNKFLCTLLIKKMSFCCFLLRLLP